jgi:hypothetical protein
MRLSTSFIADAVRRVLDDEHRWELIESAVGSIAGEGHEWDDDAAAWVGAQRRADPSRVA